MEVATAAVVVRASVAAVRARVGEAREAEEAPALAKVAAIQVTLEGRWGMAAVVPMVAGRREAARALEAMARVAAAVLARPTVLARAVAVDWAWALRAARHRSGIPCRVPICTSRHP